MIIIDSILKFINMIGPLGSVAFATLIAWGVVKWIKRLGFAVKGLSQSPITFIWWLISVAAVLWLYYKYIGPMLSK